MKLFRLLLVLGLGCGSVMAVRPNPLIIAPTTPGIFQLSWLADNQRPYKMESSPDLFVWAEFGPMVVGSGSTQGMLVTATTPKLFYRLREGAMRPGFDELELPKGDDSSSPGLVPIGFTVNFYGEYFSDCYVNNNGNITFGLASGTYTPTPLGGTYRKIIAPFWADVDTEGLGSGVTRYTDNSATATTVDGHPAFGATYRNVGYYQKRSDKLNSFQIILIDRSDIASGDFDIEFNYNKVLWETGRFSGGSDGYGGNSARAGVSNSDGSYVEYKGSGQTLAFLDANPQTGVPNYQSGLIYQTYNSTCPGRIVLPFRSGEFAAGFKINAGSDQTLGEFAGATAQLSGSVDPLSPSGIEFLWSKVSGPGEAEFSDTTALMPTVTISEPGEYEFKLTAKRQDGTFEISNIDTVRIEHPAFYEVYSDSYELWPTDSPTLTLDQAVASAPAGVTFSIQWTQVSGDPATIENPTVLQPAVTLPGPGFYSFLMTATTNHASPFVFTSVAYVDYYAE